MLLGAEAAIRFDLLAQVSLEAENAAEATVLMVSGIQRVEQSEAAAVKASAAAAEGHRDPRTVVYLQRVARVWDLPKALEKIHVWEGFRRQFAGAFELDISILLEAVAFVVTPEGRLLDDEGRFTDLFRAASRRLDLVDPGLVGSVGVAYQAALHERAPELAARCDFSLFGPAGRRNPAVAAAPVAATADAQPVRPGNVGDNRPANRLTGVARPPSSAVPVR